jgi:hypothetical protein
MTVSLTHLARLMHQPQARRGWQWHAVGPLSVLHQERPDEAAAGRWLSLLTLQDRFLLLVDEFRANQPSTFSLRLQNEHSFKGGRLRYVSRVGREPFAVQLLGDYQTEAASGVLTWRQRLMQGRFLLAITRTLEARVRVLHGWAVELRDSGRVEHILFANRSARLRPLGPVQTDARFAAASWSQSAEHSTGFGAQLLLLGAKQLRWGSESALTATQPFDLHSGSFQT